MREDGFVTRRSEAGDDLMQEKFNAGQIYLVKIETVVSEIAADFAVSAPAWQ
jgi:hypothetical protein